MIVNAVTSVLRFLMLRARSTSGNGSSSGHRSNGRKREFEALRSPSGAASPPSSEAHQALVDGIDGGQLEVVGLHLCVDPRFSPAPGSLWDGHWRGGAGKTGVASRSVLRSVAFEARSHMPILRP